MSASTTGGTPARRRWLRGLAIAAVVAVPLAFAGLFIGAISGSADATDRIPAALVNQDELIMETADDGSEMPIFAGRQLVTELVADGGFDWTITNADDADAALARGDVFAVLTIPKEFSAAVLSISGDSPRQAEIDIRTDDAHSYLTGVLSESVGDSMANAFGTAITEQFITGMYSGLGELGSALGEAADGAGELSDGVDGLSSGLSELSSGVASTHSGAGSLASGVSKYTQGVDQLSGGLAQLASGANTAQGGANSLASGVTQYTQGVDQLSTGLGQLNAGAQGLGALSSGVTQFTGGVSQLEAALAAASAQLTAVPSDPAAVATVAAISAQLTAAAGDGTTLAQQVNGTLTEVQGGIAGSASGAANLAASSASLRSGAGSVAGGLQSLASGISQSASGASQAAAGSASLRSGANSLAGGLGSLSGGVSSAADGADELATGAEELASGLQEGADQVPAVDETAQNVTAQVAADPVGITVTRDNKIVDAAQGVAAFIAPLSLWLGALAVFLIMRPIPRRMLASTARTGRLWRSELGRASLVTTGQALLVVALLHLVAGVSWTLLPATLGFSVLAALAFTALHHLFMSAFGRAGLVVSLLLLAIQVTSTGGLYPIHLLAEPYQLISPLLPLTYAVNGMQAILAGGAAAPVWGAVVALLIFGLTSALLSFGAIRRVRRAAMLHPSPVL